MHLIVNVTKTPIACLNVITCCSWWCH